MEGGFRNPVATIIAPGVVDTAALADGAITSIKLASGLQSDNYNGTDIATGDATQGWRIERNTGSAEFQDLRLRGSIIGNLTMTTAGKIRTAASGLRVEMGGSVGIFQLFSGDTDEVDEARIGAFAGGGGAAEQIGVRFRGPARTGGGSPVSAFLDIYSEAGDSSLPVQAILRVGNTPTATGPPEFKLADNFRLLLSDGTVSRPALASINDLDTGLYSPANGQIAVASQGAQVALFTENGLNSGNGILGYAQATATQGSIGNEVDLTNLAVTVTVKTNRRIRIHGYCMFTAGGGFIELRIRDGSTRIAQSNMSQVVQYDSLDVWAVHTPSAGSHTYKLTAYCSGGPSAPAQLLASGEYPAFILVEDIGSA